MNELPCGVAAPLFPHLLLLLGPRLGLLHTRAVTYKGLFQAVT